MASEHEHTRSRLRLVAASVGVCGLLLLVAATAQAQEDPYATVEEQATTSDLDTDVTPVAKETELWTLLHGAEYPQTQVIEGSATTFSTELHTVSFRNTTIGLAGGSACAIEPVQQAKEDPQAFGARVGACEGLDGQSVPRVPVLYRYSVPADADPLWERLPLPNQEDHAPGYIASIAWIDADRALIVGGTGTYPRREAPADGKTPTDPDKADQAGAARAWLYRRSTGEAEELDLSALTPDTPATGATPARAGMRGLTAAACYADPNPQPGEKKLELCFAGALGQLWEWRDGAFNGERVDAESPDAKLKDAPLFRYRVRDIVFTDEEPPVARAVTSGCCAPDPNQNTPRVIRYDDSPGVPRPCTGAQCTRKAPPRWFAEDFFGRGNVNPTNPLPPSVETPGEVTTPGSVSPEDAGQAWVCFWAPASCPTPVPGGPQTLEIPGGPRTLEVPGGGKPVVPTETEHDRRETNDKPQWPDSIYAIFSGAAILSPGGEERAGEPASFLTGRGFFNSLGSVPEAKSARTAVSTARLLDGDGDVACTDPVRPSGGLTPDTSECSGPDHEPDWVVGELRSTARGELGTRGLLVAAALAPTARESINAEAECRDCASSNPKPAIRPTPEEATQSYEPIDQAKLDAYRRSQHYLLPSYTANAIEIVGDQEDGWMVGEHGAILRLSSEQLQETQGATEPEPPRLGGARSKPLSDRDAYAGANDPLPADAGVVPAIGAETEALDEPEMIGTGSPGGSGVDEIIMSRDGSEGWAFNGTELSYFDGVTWKRCDPVGIEGLTEPDPACEALAYRDANGAIRRVRLDHVARVPLENDPDPTNDDELEIVAIGASCKCPAYKGATDRAFVRYRDGRWRFEELGAVRTLGEAHYINPSTGQDVVTGGPSIIDMAFTAPDDGWLVAAYRNAGQARVYRFNGESWTECWREPACQDPDGRLSDVTRTGNYGLGPAGLVAAGDRVYLYGSRVVGAACVVSGVCPNSRLPMIVYRDRGGKWTDGSERDGDDAGFDPGFSDPVPEEFGQVESLSVAERPDGEFEGWAVGYFASGAASPSSNDLAQGNVPPDAVLMRLDPGSGDGWEQFRSPGALEDAMLCCIAARTHSSDRRLQVSYPSGSGATPAFIAQERQQRYGGLAGHTFAFDEARERFRPVDSARPQGLNNTTLFGHVYPDGHLTAMAPDGQGGFWAAVSGYFFHYTDKPPKQVFSETANPLGTRGAELTALDGGPDGSIWAATDSDRLYRYDRATGWEEARIPGWDPGRVVTRASAVNAIAVGPGGEGLAVGEGGRIAALSATAIRLDPAAGRSCALGDRAPCSTSRDLRAVDIAPDGSATAAGDRLTVLWRAPGGAFQSIKAPSIGSSTNFTAASMPTPERAYLVSGQGTGKGAIFAGQMSSPGQWSWRIENAIDGGERYSSADAQGRPLALNDLEVDQSGHGYAVGEQGLVLERSPDGAWRRIESPVAAELTSVALPESGGGGVLIGGADGLILTGARSELRIARPADYHARSALTGDVVGFAYLPGSTAGSVDAWAGTSSAGEGDSRLLRHRSDPNDAALDPAAATDALPDAPAQQAGELSLAAFGKSDCDMSETTVCPAMSATTTTNELVSDRIAEELGELREAGDLDLTLGTGDAVDSAGLAATSLADPESLRSIPGTNTNRTQTAGQLKHRRWSEQVADELEDEGVPLFAALGGQDLTETYTCSPEGGCESVKEIAVAGENLAWREALAGRAEPWGSGADTLGAETAGEIQFEPARGSEDNSLRVESQKADADGDEGQARPVKAEIGGASTHYALDATRDGEAVARIVFVDTSLKSLAASDPLQQPHELAGAQQRFLERMICREGDTTTTAIDECTREPQQKAIVVSNTPTYSYGPGALTHTATDATTFEALMLRHRVDLVVSGALGYNGLYYTLAPGIHEPCPAGAYPEAPPADSTPDCLAGPTGPADEAQKRLRESPAGANAPAADPASLIAEQGLSGAYPTLIASGAGGKFGPNGNEPPDGPAGQWHGYSLARLLTSGDLVVEQRPILDWVGMDAPDHAVAPRARMKLTGYGRSPISTGVESAQSRAFHYEISTPAITHRYDLLLADPDEPWLPCSESNINCQELHANLIKPSSEAEATPTLTGADNPCSPYLCLPSRIGVVDDQSGQVRAGDGKYPETFAIAMLSVDEEVATYPLVFTRSPSFVTRSTLRTLGAPPTSGARTPAPPPPPPPPGLPQIPNVEIPQIPPPPAIPQLTAATPPELQPPAPPAPPPPSQQPSPLDLTVAPPGVSISTPTALIQPPTPPVNPAPPGGARREARQRQAAAQKGGAENTESANDGISDAADGPPSASGSQQMTRHDASFLRHRQGRPEPSFTAYRPRADSSPLGTGALYAGGLGLLAFALAAGWTHGRPGPRGRSPELPAPAESTARTYRR